MRTLAVISLFFSVCAQAQFGGYQSLHAPSGARNAALGGRVTSLADGDLLQFYHNPSVLDSVAAGQVAINFTPYFAGIYSFTGAGLADFQKVGKLAFGLTYLDYGTFSETADNGTVTGQFSARDYLVTVARSHAIGPFAMGVSLKYAYYGIAGYGSSLVLADLGGVYRAPGRDLTFGLVFKNMGFVVSDYFAKQGGVPFDVQMSTTFKPEYMPFRFSISAYNLTEQDVYFKDESDAATSRPVEIADKLFRKVNLGMELIVHQNIRLLFGYNHLRRKELRLSEAAKGAGMSYGLMINIKQFSLRYTHATYHAAGGSDFFTVQTNLNSFRKNF